MPLIYRHILLFIFVLTIHWHIKITSQTYTNAMPTNLLQTMLPGLSSGLEHKLEEEVLRLTKKNIPKILMTNGTF